jgi:predicted P-loop ATPase
MADGPIDFADLAAALLARADTLVPQWLPGGKKSGYNWMCGGLDGSPGRSLGVNLNTGAWAEFAGDDKGGDLISLYAAINNLNQGQAARQLQQDLGWALPVQASARARPQPQQQQQPAPRPPASEPAQALDGVGAVDARPEPPADEPQAGTERRKSLWRAIVPVPAHAPAPDFRHWHYATPAATWEYRFDGVLYGHVVRYTTSDGGKEVLPHTWCVDESDTRGTCRWHFKQWDEPRPLYVPATLLSADKALPVVLVEGEKCALAGHQLLGHEFDFVTWPGGGKAWPKAALGWLAGRRVILWPDCDAKRERLTKAERDAGIDPATKPLQPEHRQPGVQAMVGAGQALVADHGCTVTLVPLPKPGAVSDGWDIADAIESGWDADTVRAFLAGAKPFVPPSDEARAKAGIDGAGGGISTPSGAGAGEDDGASAGWRARLLLTSQGAIKPVRENIVLALDGVPETGVAGIPECAGVIGYNEFTNDLLKTRDTPWGTQAGEWQEVDELLMGEWLVREHWLPSMPRGTLEEAVRMVAYRHRFHPVRTYLQGLKWDGVKRLPTWLRRACLEEDEWDDGAPLQRYLARVGTFFLMGMCARVMHPGTKFDWMLILEGAQGMRKSTLLRVLAGEYFADTGLVLGDKDSYQQLQGRWLYEFGELDSFGKAEVTKIKSFIASSSDYFRASFDRRAREYPRQLVFGGTTNEDHYLTDPTGNRRFWPVRVTQVIDIDWVLANRDQLFAEAMARLEAGSRSYPTPDEERELFVPQQQQRAVENAIEAAVNAYLTDPNQKTGMHGINGSMVNEISLVDLLGRIGISIEKLGPGRFHEKQAAAALRRMGWTEGRSSKPGRPRVYRRPDGDKVPLPAGWKPVPSRDDKADMQTGATQPHQPEGADSDCPF